jgi:DNA repair exonuclease SbcCD ATPase subunit
MPLLSRNAQLEVDNAKDGIEDFQERIDNLNGFINGFVLWVQDLERFARQISQIEQDLMKLIEKHFGAGSTEAQQLIERTRIGTVPPGLTKDGLHRQLERNVARAQDALQDGISILQERIATLRATGATTPNLSCGRTKKRLRQKRTLSLFSNPLSGVLALICERFGNGGADVNASSVLRTLPAKDYL